MNFFSLTMRIISAFLMAYFFLIFARIILTWFPENSSSVTRVKEILTRITEPYMRHFRNLRWLRIGMFDFSAVLGLSILSFALYITQILAVGSFPGAGEFLLWILKTIWGFISFILFFLILLLLVRLICVYLIRSNNPSWMERLDGILFPFVSRVLGIFTSKTISYTMALFISLIIFLTIRILGTLLLTRILAPLLLL